MLPIMRPADTVKGPDWHLTVAAMAWMLAVGWLIRQVGGFPRCPTDELNWSHIANQVQRGVDWPVSGPLHLQVAQFIHSTQQWTFESIYSALGLASLPITGATLMWGYGRMLPARHDLAWISLWVLSCSTYFWGGVIESRPQQWGQLLVFAALIHLWEILKGRGHWWIYAALVIGTLVTHILSFAILFFLSWWLLFWAWLQRGNCNSHAWKMTGLFIGCCALLGWPKGPYRAIIGDIMSNHLRMNWSGFHIISIVIGSLLLIGAPVILRRKVSGPTAFILQMHPIRLARSALFSPFMLAILIGVLSLQAYLLPIAAWRPYAENPFLFAFVQLGNVSLSLCVIMGLGRADKEELRALIPIFAIGTGLAILALSLLLLSFRLLDTNWMLRVINYFVLFLAPVAAIGVKKVLNRGLTWVAWFICVAGAVSFTARVAPFFNC